MGIYRSNIIQHTTLRPHHELYLEAEKTVSCLKRIYGGLAEKTCVHGSSSSRFYREELHNKILVNQRRFYRASYASAVLGVVILSVRLSVCPSVTRVLCD